MSSMLKQQHLKGNPIAPGIAIGPLLLYCFQTASPSFNSGNDFVNVEEELIRYRSAIHKGKEDLEILVQAMPKDSKNEAIDILEAQLQLLYDPVITCDVETEIRRTKKKAEFVLHTTLQGYQNKFNALSNIFFRERFADFEAIMKRILSCLQGERKKSEQSFHQAVIYTRELSFIDLAEATVKQAEGFLTEYSSTTSHVAIIAKAKGIPFVTGIDFASVEDIINASAQVIIDGYTGDVFLAPSEETYKRYTQELEKLNSPQSFRQGTASSISETFDGYYVRLSANIEMVSEAKQLRGHGGSGIGLFRSEYAFLAFPHFPQEEEQFEAYKEAIDHMQGLPMAIRVFDLGGDKHLLGQKMPVENNPFLGCRAIRFLLKEKILFKTQLRAILRASIYGDISIMLPMVSSLSELLEAKAVIEEAQDEVEMQLGRPLPKVKVGCMIEVPSAALMVDVFAKECDFLSIGTNDLVQYTLAVDRSNHALNGLYNPFHPSVIRLIKLIITEANCIGIPVSVCGEVAANPKFTALLIGLGVHELSVALRHIATIKETIRHTSIVDAIQLAEHVLAMSSPEEVELALSSKLLKIV